MFEARPFMDDLLTGRGSTHDFDDRVDAWHCLAESDPRSTLALHEFLGLSWDEYAVVSGNPSNFSSVIAARRPSADAGFAADGGTLAAVS